MSNIIGSGDSGVGGVGSVFASTLEANEEFYEWLGDVAKAYAGDGLMEVDGRVIDLTTISGAAYITAETQIMNAILETINNVLNYLKQFEKTIASTAS